MKDVKEYFKHYPKSVECYQTSDGFIFHADFDAQSHAASLKEKKVEKHVKGKVTATKTDPSTSTPSTPSTPSTGSGADDPGSKPKGGRKAGKPA